MLGLLGTVWGIMRAFHDLASTGSAGPSVVAAGIAEALFTTAAGLVVAVPAVMLLALVGGTLLALAAMLFAGAVEARDSGLGTGIEDQLYGRQALSYETSASVSGGT